MPLDTALACGTPMRSAKQPLELRHARAERQLPGPQDLRNGALLLVAEDGLRQRDLAHAGSVSSAGAAPPGRRARLLGELQRVHERLPARRR